MKKYLQPLWDFLEDHPLPDDDQLMDVADDVIAGLEKERVGFEIVPVILELMAAYPLVNFGSPGSLTHFVEHYYTSYKETYEAALLASVGRLPSVHTLWLLNRVVNAQDGAAREPYLAVLRQTVANERYLPEIRQQAQDFLDVQLEKEM